LIFAEEVEVEIAGALDWASDGSNGFNAFLFFLRRFLPFWPLFQRTKGPLFPHERETDSRITKAQKGA
jgi:hypothetical protein